MTKIQTVWRTLVCLKKNILRVPKWLQKYKWGGGTMGHFRESSYAYIFFQNGTILTTITSTTSIHKGKATTATINVQKKTFMLFLPVIYKGEGMSASRRVGELILGSNWGRIQFPIHWCTLQVWWPHHGRTLPVERSPLSALVTKIAFSVSIGWQPIVPPPLL